ncbi:MAG: hypothetical protein WC641_04575 [Patescibacteria group bacterium]
MTANPFEIAPSVEPSNLTAAHIKRQDLPTPVREYADNLAAQIKQIYAKYGAENFEELKKNKKLSAQDARKVADLLKSFQLAVEKKRSENLEFLSRFKEKNNGSLVSQGHVFIKQRHSDGKDKIFKDGQEVYFSHSIDRWEASGGHFIIQQGKLGEEVKIFQDGKEVFSGKAAGWLFDGGHLYIQQNSEDGTSKILKDGEEVFSGEPNGWRVADGHLFVLVGTFGSKNVILKDGKEVFKGKVTGWRVGRGHVFVEQGLVDQKKILKDGKVVYSGVIQNWDVSEDHFFVDYRNSADRTWRFLKDGQEILSVERTEMWRVTGGHLYNEHRQDDGTKIILKDGKDFFAGKYDDWKTAEGQVYIVRKAPDGSEEYYRVLDPEKD